MSESIINSNLLILASAGSGKTYQLGNRVIGRVAEGVDPAKIVALTFTRKAAGEFADSVLGKLAEAVLDPATAARLSADLGRVGESPSFQPELQTIVRSLPKFTLTTIDSFFTRVVRGFQYELGLTGGRFDLLEGPRAAAARDELLGDLLGRALDDGRASTFAHAFRRATAGRESVGVANGLRQFIDTWHRHYAGGQPCQWGPDFLATVAPEDWEKQKPILAEAAHAACDGITETRKGQLDALAKFIDTVAQYTLSGGGFPNSSKLATGLLDAAAIGATGQLTLDYYKAFDLPPRATAAITALIRLAAASEMAAAVARTRAIFEVVTGYDALAESRLRRRGLLGFDDVKLLMGEWSRGEDARVRRELVDFRLDARYEHWLLDEFQDTSREEWLGLLPLLHEAVSAGDGSLFIVGDRKQAIYGWRGGDVSLFDEVRRTFGSGITSIPMAQSWRSCPEVLSLVNQVCGNAETIRTLFGIDADRWQWDAHHSAPPLISASRAGEACVEYFDLSEAETSGQSTESEDETEPNPDDPRITRMIERMRELGIGEKNLTCGVLVRRNGDARSIADTLRAAGFDVVLDGVGEPAKDHPVGVAVWQLLRWLANPQDTYAQRVIESSPLASALRPSPDTPWYQIWETLLTTCQAHGFSRMIERLLEPLLPSLSAYGKKRLVEIIEALATFDAGPDSGAHAAARWIERLEIPQSPGAAAVQVMTIHKSKGLGFDVVFLPIVPDRRIPEANRFTIAEGDGWLTSVPASWARSFFPEIQNAEADWIARERYEGLCQLYVGLTRAKRGLYVYLGKKSKTPKTDSPTLTNLLLQALGAPPTPGIAWQSGNPDWATQVAARPQVAHRPARPSLGSAIPRRNRVRPSQEAATHPATHAPVANPAGMAFGSEVHACFEKISWLHDFHPASLPDTAAARSVIACLDVPAIAALFTRPPGRVALHREQAIDAIVPSGWLTGIIDRMHIHFPEDSAQASRIEIIDFKTDAVTDPEILRDRHTAQMHAYAQVASMLHPGARIDLILISVALKQIVPVPFP